MAIEISAQFTKFTQFAADSIARGEKGADTIARLDAEDPLGGRTIQAKTGDKIGKWVRSDSLKETNDRVRELFRQTVADMFGGVERIPESVLKAMKLEDYGKGKPLSAPRRRSGRRSKPSRPTSASCAKWPAAIPASSRSGRSPSRT